MLVRLVLQGFVTAQRPRRTAQEFTRNVTARSNAGRDFRPVDGFRDSEALPSARTPEGRSTGRNRAFSGLFPCQGSPPAP